MNNRQPEKPSSIFTRLARSALEAYVRSGSYPALPQELPSELTERRACFVSLKVNGQLRGCIGTIEPSAPSLAMEIIHNAIAAGTRDPRFLPVQENELEEIEYSVDVLSQPEPISSLEGHDPKRHGLIVEHAGRRGLLLPDLEGVDTAEYQFEICLAKAGLKRSDPVKLYRFTVERYI